MHQSSALAAPLAAIPAPPTHAAVSKPYVRQAATCTTAQGRLVDISGGETDSESEPDEEIGGGGDVEGGPPAAAEAVAVGHALDSAAAG